MALSLTKVLVLFGLLTGQGLGLPVHAQRATVLKGQDEVLEEYDFVVVGAGTAGLTVADRLTESGEYTVLVVEYGYLDTSHTIEALTVPDIASGPPDIYPRATRMYNLSSVPQTGLDGTPKRLAAGAVVGGSSAVNGMVFMRGSAEDYDAWVWAAGEEHQEEFAAEWGWDNLLPYFRKSVTFEPPTEDMVEQYGITYDVEAAYGGSTPVWSSYRPFNWPATIAMWDAFKQLPGYRFPKEAASGDASGIYWTPNSINPHTERRSFSRTGHYEGEPAKRDNLHLLPAHRVTQLLLTKSNGSESWAAEGVRFVPRDSNEEPREVRAKREVIVAAGAVHTPQVLQRSGIGPRGVLDAAGVEVRVELPGVGENLQDHPNLGMSYQFSKQYTPNSAMLQTDPEFAAEALELWETNKTGPYTAYLNSVAFLPLNLISDKTDEIVRLILDQDPGEYLRSDADPTVIAGYVEQKKTLARQFQSDKSTLLEVPFSGNPFFSTVLLKSLSRGTLHISPDDDGVDPSGRGDMEPVLDFGTFSNPVDLDLVVEMVKGVRGFMSSAPFVEAFGPVETSPGEDMTDEDELKAWIARMTSPSTAHPIGTAALAPLELGGVVGPDLTVYGTRKLSIADNSIIPLIPSTHTSSTAYAIGEKAADMVLRRASSA